MSDRFSAQFPFQGFNQGGDSSEEESEDDYNQLPGLFCSNDSRSIVERGVAACRKELGASGRWAQGSLPEHHRVVMWALSEAAALEPLEFSEASDHDLIPPEFYDAGSGAEDFSGRNAAHVYGELTLDGVDGLVDVFAQYSNGGDEEGIRPSGSGTGVASPADRRLAGGVLVDLGSGLGKIVLQLALDVRCSAASTFLGVELAQSRHNVAVAGCTALESIGRDGVAVRGDVRDELRQSMVSALRSDDVSSAGAIKFIRGDITLPIYRDATHVFANSLLFPAVLSEKVCRELSQCPRLRVVVSSRTLPLPESIFRLAGFVPLAVSWQNELFPMAVYVDDVVVNRLALGASRPTLRVA